MALEAYIDDSATVGEVYVLAGHIATPEAWRALSKEWESLLPRFGVLDKDNQYHFKMKEMVINEERLERIPAFMNLIHQHVLCSISCAFDVRDLERAKRRIFVPNVNINWGDFKNPYFIAFRALMDMFHSPKNDLKKEGLSPDQKVDFIFDEQTEKSLILSRWDSYMRGRSEDIRSRFGAMPRFEDDKKCLPIQAADLWAWCVRRWVEEGASGRIGQKQFGLWKGTRKDHLNHHMSFNESELIASISNLLRPMLKEGQSIHIRDDIA